VSQRATPGVVPTRAQKIARERPFTAARHSLGGVRVGFLAAIGRNNLFLPPSRAWRDHSETLALDQRNSSLRLGLRSRVRRSLRNSPHSFSLPLSRAGVKIIRKECRGLVSRVRRPLGNSRHYRFCFIVLREDGLVSEPALTETILCSCRFPRP
jgi:hypothetical protein